MNEYVTWAQASELAKRLIKLEKAQRSAARAAADLRHSAIDSGRGLVLKDEQGNEKYRLGTDENGVTAPQYKGGPVPAQPEPPHVDAGQRVIKVQHSGLDINEEPAPVDFKVAEVHVSQDQDFEPSLSTLGNHIAVPNGSVDHSLPAGEWYVGIVWVTLSGKRSPMSEPVTAVIEPPVDAQDIQDTLDEAQARLDEYRDEVAQPRFQALEQGLSENNDTLANARERLEEAEQTLSPLPERMEAAERNVEEARDKATEASAAAIEANNRAMTRLANGNFENDLLYWEHHNVTLTSTAHSGQQAAHIGASGWLRPASSFPVVPGQIWELSLYYQYDVTVELQAIDGDTRTVLSTHHLDGDSTWSDSGALRVTIPADVHMLSFTITGNSAIVDDITLRDVTDVVRLEQAANANRQKAEQAISELAVLQLAVDGEGGLKDRLQSAETVLETKADEAVVDNVAAGLAGLSGLNTRTYIQDDEPPAPSGAVTYEWEGEPHASPSVKKVDGVEVFRNIFPDPQLKNRPEWGTTHAEITAIPKGSLFPNHGDWVSGDVLRVDLITPDRTASFFASNRFPLDRDLSSVAIKVPMQGTGRVWIYFRNSDGGTVGTHRQTAVEEYPAGGILELSGPIPSDTAFIDIYFGSLGSSTDHVFFGSPVVTLADSEQAALDQIQTYFDGDTPDAPAETGLWIRGEDKFWFDHTTKQWVGIQDTGAFARLIANELFATLGVFNRLQAREGWIGGTLLADGAVTAEKIHATRELITKIMGAEWAYIAQQLIVDGKILTRDLEALSAAIQSLTVTQRADIAQLWAEELWTALAVIEELQAEEAWITSAMISELTAEKVTVTQEFVARIGEFAEILANKVWANQAFIDRMAASEAYFGSEDADQQTRVNGQGVTLYRLIDGKLIPAAQFGGGITQLAFFDGNDSVGSIDQHGNAAFQHLSANNLTVAGREVFPPNPAPDYEGYLFDALPRGIIDKAPTDGSLDMAGFSAPEWGRYGFLEVSARVIAGREYRVSHTPFRMHQNDGYFGFYTHTFSPDGPPDAPHTESDQLGNRWVMTGSTAQTGGGEHVFTCTQTGVMRILLNVARSDGEPGIHFHGSTLYANNIFLTLEDLGPARGYTGLRRHAGSHGTINPVRDSQPLIEGLVTSWQADWMQTYIGLAGNGAQLDRPGLNSAITGRNPESGRYYATIIGGFQTTPGTGYDQGQTMQTALAGAELLSARIITTGVSQPSAQRGITRMYWHAHNQPPQVLHMVNPPPNHIFSAYDNAGATRSTQAPPEMLTAIQDGTFQGITIHPVSPEGNRGTANYHGIVGLGERGISIELTYQ